MPSLSTVTAPSRVAPRADLPQERSALPCLLQTITAMQCYRTALSMCLERDMEFHSRLMRASGNLAFEIMFAPVMELLRDQRYKTVR